MTTQRDDLRSVPPEAWQHRLPAIAKAIGVTRIGDATGFDRIGIPVFQAVRPMARSLSVSQGKGTRRPQARLSALLEALELHCGENCRPAEQTGSLRQIGPAWASGAADLDADRGWLTGRDLLRGGVCLVPRARILLDMTGPAGDVPVDSDGMGAGGTVEEAALAGLCEVIEREAHVRWQALPTAARAATAVDPASIDDEGARALLARIADAGCDVRLSDLSEPFGVPAFLCVISERDRARPMPPAGGSGCHPDRGIALARAILEAAQSRVTARAGAREDLSLRHYEEAGRFGLAFTLELAMSGPPRSPFAAAPHASHRSVPAALDALLRAVEPMGGPVAMVDLTDPAVGVPVVRVLTPWQRAPRHAPGGAPAQPPPPGTSLEGKRLIFVGPTAPALLAEPPPGFVSRLPARCGDVAAAIAERPAAIGLIDGLFGTAPSVWHKELLFAIEAGIPVYGAASLGALRAAELAPFGMIGVGEVFAAYAAGRIVRDDAVLVEQAPPALGCRALTPALIDMLATLRRCPLPPGLRRRLAIIAARLPLAERGWARVIEVAGIAPEEQAPLLARLAAATVSIKEADAHALVAAMAGPLAPASLAQPVPRTRFVATLSLAPLGGAPR